MAPTLGRDALHATRDLPPVRLSEIGLRTARDPYTQVLAILDPVQERV